MYIYTNPHRSQHSTNFTNAQIHQVTYSIMTQFINQSIPNVTSMYSSNTLIIKQSSFTCKQLRLMPIMLCAYSRHIYACGTNHQQRSSPHHHHSFSIYVFTNNSSFIDIYAITNNIHNSINIYVFTNNITINQHICIDK